MKKFNSEMSGIDVNKSKKIVLNNGIDGQWTFELWSAKIITQSSEPTVQNYELK